MAKWVCSVCGYVHEGDEAPEVCPVCKAPASKFIKQDAEMTWAAEHVVGVAKGRYGKNGIVLTKDMCGILTHGDEMPVAVHAVSPNPSAWATGKFIYRNTPIDEVLKELSLYYGTLLYASEHERTITGEFKTDDLGEIIALIEKTLDIKITQKE